MNYVLIFKNAKALQDAEIDTIQLAQPIEKVPGTKIFLFDDSESIEKVKTRFQEELKNKENTFYVVLHFGKQSTLKAGFVKAFGPNVITQSNIRGDFYYSLLPKLIEGNLTFEEINSFFPDISLETKLSLLHKLLGGDFSLNKDEINLVEQYGFPLKDYENNFTDNPDSGSLLKFRDQLFK